MMVRNLLARRGPMARFELSRETGLTPPAVTGLVASLIRQGLACETGRRPSNGGRPPIMVDLAPGVGVCLAMRVQRGEAAAGLFDLRGQELAAEGISLDTSEPQAVGAALGEMYHSLIGRLGRELGRRPVVLQAALATPGLIDPDEGIVDRSSNLGWAGVPIASILQRAIGVGVVVENISNAAALAEQRAAACEAGEAGADLVYLNLSAGIGAGIIAGGKVFSGAHGYAGEIGHTPVQGCEGAPCYCGRTGCMEAVCSARAVALSMNQFLGWPAEAHVDVAGLLDGPLGALEGVRAVISRAAVVTGRAVATLASLFDTSTVVLGGEMAAVGGSFIEQVADVARASCLAEIASRLEVRAARPGVDLPLMGAALIAAERAMAMDEWPARCGHEHTGEGNEG